MNEGFPARATIDDVAREAGVSSATVSRALRDHPYVAESTKQKVLSAVERLQYVANSNASRLASGQSRTVGLVTPLVGNWYTSEIVVGAEEVLADAQFDLLITAAACITGRDTRFHQRVDGLMLAGVRCAAQDARLLLELATPVVVVGQRLDGNTSISTDNVRGARLAARHLIQLGHRRIALAGADVRLDVHDDVAGEIEAGFRAELHASGLAVPEWYVCEADSTIDGGRRAMEDILALSTPPTAVFFVSDEMAFGAMWALRSAGMRPGRDISVVGFGDHPVAEAMGLTTVRQAVRDLGRLGARLLLDACTGVGMQQHQQLEPTLVTRESSGPPNEDISGF